MDPTFLTTYPHLDLAYNSTCTIVACSVSMWFAGNFTDNVALMSSGETVALSMLSVVFGLTHIQPALLKIAERRVVEYECVEGDDDNTTEIDQVKGSTEENNASQHRMH